MHSERLRFRVAASGMLQEDAQKARSVSRHRRPDRLTDWNTRRIEIVETKNVDAEVVRSDALAVERIDAAGTAEEMARGPGMELIFAEVMLSREKAKPALVHLDHQCVLPAADRAVAGGQFRKVGFDLEAHGPAVAAS